MFNPGGRRFLGPPPRFDQPMSGPSPFNLPPPVWRGPPGWQSGVFGGQQMSWPGLRRQPLGPPLIDPNRRRDFLGPVMEPPPRWLGPPGTVGGPAPGWEPRNRLPGIPGTWSSF